MGDGVLLPAMAEVKDVFRALLLPALQACGATGHFDTHLQLCHDLKADFHFALLFEHELSESEALFALPKDNNKKDGGGGWNRKRGPPPGVPVMPDSPAGLWQIQAGPHTASVLSARRVPVSSRC